MFEETLIIMERTSEEGINGPEVSWEKGETIKAKLSISNMKDMLIANAEVVRAKGYLVVKTDNDGKPIYPIKRDTYLEYPRGGLYIRVLDNGIVEAGSITPFKERQYAVETYEALPE